MTKISPNLRGGLDNGYKFFELFLENIFFVLLLKFFKKLKFFRNHKIIKKIKMLVFIKVKRINLNNIENLDILCSV